MDLQYLTFVGRNLENKKQLTLLQMMNNAGLDSKNIMNSFSIFNDNMTLIGFVGYNIGMNNISCA